MRINVRMGSWFSCLELYNFCVVDSAFYNKSNERRGHKFEMGTRRITGVIEAYENDMNTVITH